MDLDTASTTPKTRPGLPEDSDDGDVAAGNVAPTGAGARDLGSPVDSETGIEAVATQGSLARRMAIIAARRAGLQPFCVTIDERAEDYLPHLFGSAGFVLIRKPAELPRRLPQLYARLTA